ncbi:hemophore [Mycobacterium sp. SMC-4]|uniref:hemophore n=1 Tax=Mycobacterium sp. SMC-4 TaxID=2857059 RepID=UPI003D0681A2
METVRSAAIALAATCAAAALTGTAMPTATAAPDPCAASSIAKTVGMVAVHTSNYLEANPDTDEALTAIAGQGSGPQAVAAAKAYFGANPTVAGDLQRLQQPLVTLSGRCKLPIDMPELLGLVQAAQTPASTPVSPHAGKVDGHSA